MAAQNQPAPEPTEAETHLSALRAGLRERLGIGPEAELDDNALLNALDAAASARAEVAPVPELIVLDSRTIQHNLFSYDLPDGGNAIAFRNQTVDLMPHDIERGERFDAFTSAPGILPDPVGTLPDYPVDAVAAEQDAWVLSATVPEVVKAVSERPEIAASVLEAEGRRSGGPRKTLLDSLATLVGS